MRLSQQTNNAIRILVWCGRHHPDLTPITEIARLSGIPEAYAFKLVNLLTKTGLVKTARGRAGGVRLAYDPDEISIGAAVRQLESFDTREESEGITPLMDGAWEAFLSHLDSHYLSEFIDSESPVVAGGDGPFMAADAPKRSAI
ncbi:RrF2 family transcriptional regulator [Amorphus orientalis]|uniref:Rrf2 family protein n=1 Tax=Amorphus orientalis TaxID=649198 RepID=A0AAE3VT22_9HYPH|nr:Rrf2 family transcriptional regulator [Amorphus orientalis]MDQ0317305.1 Rrf2 family protein [Amorphus orientalis]